MNYKLIIQYDGTNYSGWQIQKNATSVQGLIQKSIHTLLKHPINLIGSGRTDAGVHALGQTANFHTDIKIDLYKFLYSLNSILPDDISIKSIDEVDSDFHSRFDASKRSYLYFFSKSKNPFYKLYSVKVKEKYVYDITKLNSMSKCFLGKKDFTSFCKIDPEKENKFCEIKNIHWKESKNFLIFYIQADRFLHGMVRTIVGTLLENYNEKFYEETILEIFDKKNRKYGGTAAPAKGLFLFKVNYK